MKKYEDLAIKYLGTVNIKIKKETFQDTQFSPKGWQYKKAGGNTQFGEKKYEKISKFELLQDDSKCARCDHDMRSFIDKVFKISDNELVIVTTSPSRSAKTIDWVFVTIMIVDGKI